MVPTSSVAGGFDVVGLGLNTIDLLAVVDEYPLPDSKSALKDFIELPGGQTATAMVACARLGWRARYIGWFGDDERGALSRESLTSDGVDVSACHHVHAPQGLSLVLVDGEGRRTILWRRSVQLDMNPEDVQESVVTAGRVLLVDCHQVAAATQAASFARNCGVPTVVDVEEMQPGIERLLTQIDILITAETFPEPFSGVTGIGSALAVLVREFRPVVACATLGRRGSLALVGGTEIFTPGFDVPVVDTTGAGDAFRGGFIAGWLKAGPNPLVEDVLRYANAVAALQTRALGARTAIPSLQEVDAFLRSEKSL